MIPAGRLDKLKKLFAEDGITLTEDLLQEPFHALYHLTIMAELRLASRRQDRSYPLPPATGGNAETLLPTGSLNAEQGTPEEVSAKLEALSIP